MGAGGPARVCSVEVRVLGVCTVLLVVAGLLLTTALVDPLPVSPVLPWPLLLVAFVVAEATVVHVHVGRQVHTTSLAEVPLVLGLFVVDPLTLLVTRACAGVLVQVLRRRLPLVKVAFNTALFLVDVGILLSVLGLVLPADAAPAAGDPAVWLAVLAAVSLASCVQAVAVSTVIGFYEGAPGWSQLAQDCLSALTVPLVLSTGALVAAAGLQSDPGFLWFVVAGAAALVLGHRAYARHWYRHLGLERMVAFSSAVRSAGLDEQTLRTVLTQARDLLVAEQASVRLLGDGADPFTATVGRDGVLRRLDGEDEVATAWLLRAVVPRGTLVLGRTTTDPDARRWLAVHGAREGVLVPVTAADEVVGVLWATDRLGGVRDLGRDDAALLEAVAGQVGLALQNGRLRRDVDQQARTEEALRRLSHHDALTGLANRRALEARLAELLAGDSDSSRDTAVLFGDLDGFKPVNDEHGHAVGDEVLVEVARRLLAAVRPDDLVARIGGDEFVVLCPAIDGDALRRLVSEVTAAVLTPLPTSAGVVGIRMSLGVATPRQGQTAAGLLADADRAMYRAKSSAAAAAPG